MITWRLLDVHFEVLVGEAAVPVTGYRAGVARGDCVQIEFRR